MSFCLALKGIVFFYPLNFTCCSVASEIIAFDKKLEDMSKKGLHRSLVGVSIDSALFSHSVQE